MTLQLTGYGYKELVHRQLYQDLYNRELPEGLEIHHIDHDPGNNRPRNLVAMLTRLCRRLHRAG